MKKTHVYFYSSWNMTILLPPPNKKYSQRKKQSTDFLIDNHPSKNNVRANVKSPKHCEVVYVNNESLNVTTNDIHANNTTTISQIYINK